MVHRRGDRSLGGGTAHDRGGQPWYSALAILTALTLRAVFCLAYRQAEELISSVVGLLGLALRVPDHTTLSRRAATLEVQRPWPRPGGDTGGRGDAEPLHLLVDSTGLKLCGAGEWLVEKHGSRTRRSWRKLHLGVDADTGWTVASALAGHDADDGAQVDLLLDRVDGPVASFTGDGADDQAGVCDGVAERHPEAAVIIPPRAKAEAARVTSASPDPGRDWDCCAHAPDPCTTAADKLKSEDGEWARSLWAEKGNQAFAAERVTGTPATPRTRQDRA